MSNLAELKVYQPTAYSPEKSVAATLMVHRRPFEGRFVTDFPIGDPWSCTFRDTLHTLAVQDFFDDEVVTEFGVGDGRNLPIVADRARGILGIDVDAWRLDLAQFNYEKYFTNASLPTVFYHCHVMEFLNAWETERSGQKIKGKVIMCLPQSPQGANNADAYTKIPELAPFASWDISGLTLNAGVLTQLRNVADYDLRSVVILSNRIPESEHARMFAETGWQVEQLFRTKNPIQQDPDTPIGWTSALDDGSRFYTRVNGAYHKISALDAEEARRASFESGAGRAGLDIYHHLTIYVLKPNHHN